jgi:hypothetical protein
MNMRFTYIFLFLLALLVNVNTAKAQQVMPKAFTEDPVKFIEEMKNFFDSYDGKAGREYIDEFNKLYWLSGKVTPEMKTMMYQNSNLMIKKKFRPQPEFYSYFNTIKALADKSVPQATINAWQTCFNKIGSGRLNKPFSDFINLGEGLFLDNKFYRSPTAEWKVTGGSWSFDCDTSAVMRFTNVTLIGFAKGDSTVISNTSGVYYVSTNKWVGTKGRVNWKRVGLNENDVYADLNKYTISVKQVSYTADTVTFVNRTYFQDRQLQGKLTEKAVPEGTELKSAFPKFESYSSRYQIKSIYPNVDFEGGFTQLGARFIGSGSKENPSRLYFKRNGKDFLTVSTTAFSFSKERVAASNAAVKFSLDNDSIFHPLVEFKYFVDTSKVEIYRSEEGGSQAPFYNSFHKVDMYVQLITWYTKDQQIQIGTLPGSTQAQATFPSDNYYRQYQYDRLQGMESIHPLIRIRNFVRDNGGRRVFTTPELASHWKIQPENLRPLLVVLSNQGFIFYDPVRDQIIYKDKTDFYIAARAGRADYDNIEFQSNVASGAANAKMNLLNYDLTIFGVKEVAISDSQNVVVFPDKDMIILKKNRNFSFEGSVMAGRFDYYGRLFTFDYEMFQINLNNVDSVRIYVDGKERDPRDPKGGFKQEKLRSVIENLNGTLKIDYPGNRSGIKSKDYGQYPIFTSEKPSFVYYDKPNVQRGVYNRDKFYFKIDPFTIDSLDNFSTVGLKFGGVLQTAGILPEVRDSIGVMPDYSLGFIKQAPPGGYPLYGGKAKFTNTINLSNRGLRGNGEIKYITSTSISKDFIFFPDSMNGTAQSFVIEEQKGSGKVEYPAVKSVNDYIHWMPKKDYMQITSRDSLFDVFNGKARAQGTLTLSPKDLRAKGTLSFSNAEMDSKNMVLKQHVVDADTSDFRLKALEIAGLAFSTLNVNAHVDFDKREGDFKANGKGSVVNFPVNQYMCFMDNFKWYMDKSEIELNGAQQGKQTAGGDKIDLEGPEFISVHPRQDSLRFRAPKAKYDLKNYIIYAKQVKEVLVADARLIPDSGNVTIEKNAVMRPLENAKIEANVVTNYHKLFNCKVEVFSRKSYKATGDYAYVDELKKEQIIHFDRIAPDTAGQTYAEGNIADSSKFMLSPAYSYSGKIILAASDQFLTFEGSAMLTHDCAIGKRRLRFKGEINPSQIYIPVPAEPTDEKGDPIMAGIMSTLDSTHVYGAFLSPKKLRTDVNVVTADGFLYFDKASREYRISNKEKLIERSLPGNYISFSTKTCLVYGEGKMNLGADLGQVMLMPVGNATHNTVTQVTTFDVVAAVDFYFDDGLLDKLIEDVNASTSLAPCEVARPTFERALTEMVGKEKADKYVTQLKLYGQYKKFPDELKFTFFFTDLQLTWNQKTRSYISSGKLGLGSIGKTQINKFVPGTFMLERKRSGDVLTIYFELDGGKWYTFTYTAGIMTAYSTNEAYNTALKEMKDDKRKKEGEKGQRNYQFRGGSSNDRSMLMKKLKRAEDAQTETPEPEGSGN